MSVQRLSAVTLEALDTIPASERDAAVSRWVGSATPTEKVDATAAAFTLAGVDIPWNRKAAYTEQTEKIAEAEASLPAQQLAAIDKAYPVAHIMLHKRAALAFKVKDAIGQKKFDTLRNGVEQRYGFDNYLRVAQDRYLRLAAFNSLRVAICTVLTTVALAFALAYAVNFGGVRWPSLTKAVLLTPLVSPPVLIATATVMLFGRRGLATHTFLDQTLGLIDAEKTNIYGFAGVILAQTLASMPAAFIVFDNVLRKHNGSLDEASANLGATHRQTFARVTLPLAWPAIKRAIVLVFILSLTDFGNPMLLGHDMPVLAEVIYDQITAYQNTPLASAICIWLLAPPLIVYLLLEIIGRRKRYSTADAGRRSELPMPGLWRKILSALTMIVTFMIIVVYATMALGAVTRVWGVDWSLTLGYFTSEGVNVGLAGSGYGSSDRGLDLVWSSLWLAVIAAPIGGLLGVVIAYVVERLRPPGANIIFFLALAPAILPGIIFGIGYIVAFNLPFGIKALALTGTSSILVINILFANLFVGVLAARASLQSMDPAVDEAAESLGAGLLSRFVRVTLPMLRPALMLGMLYVFIDALTTLSSVIFLVSGNHKLASVAIFNHAESGDFGYAGAKSVVILALALLAMGLIWLVEERRNGRMRKRRLPNAFNSSRLVPAE
jgi:iron(III) transport system permease protein